MSDFQAKLERLLDEHVGEMSCKDHGVVPVVADYILIVALDDAGDAEGGGMYVGSKGNTPLYRTIGLLHEANRIVVQPQHRVPPDE